MTPELADALCHIEAWANALETLGGDGAVFARPMRRYVYAVVKAEQEKKYQQAKKPKRGRR